MVATAASAQTPGVFQLKGVLSGAPIADGGYVSPYTGSIGPDYVTDLLLAWCVDLNHETQPGNPYDVIITPLTSSDFSGTLFPTFQAQYEWSAYLANYDMASDDVSLTGFSGATGKAEATTIQTGIWAIMEEHPTETLADFTSSSVAGTLGINGSTNFASDPTGTYGDFNIADWALVTCHTDANTACGNEQEFLIYQPGIGTPEGNVTPEPATLSLMGTGLAGVLGMGFKRRRKNKVA